MNHFIADEIISILEDYKNEKITCIEASEKLTELFENNRMNPFAGLIEAAVIALDESILSVCKLIKQLREKNGSETWFYDVVFDEKYLNEEEKELLKRAEAYVLAHKDEPIPISIRECSDEYRELIEDFEFSSIPYEPRNNYLQRIVNDFKNKVVKTYKIGFKDGMFCIGVIKNSLYEKLTNKIEIRDCMIPSGYKNEIFFIDGRPLYEYINEWLKDKDELTKSVSPTDALAISWTNEYDFEGDAQFMRFVLDQDRAVTPILICPEDMDFSCIVIVADVVKKDDKVIWKRIGKVDHSAESFDEEKNSGVLNGLDVDSPKWREWVSENWTDELFCRRKNYTFPYYQNEKNIEWFSDCEFVFDRKEYDELVDGCYKS